MSMRMKKRLLLISVLLGFGIFLINHAFNGRPIPMESGNAYEDDVKFAMQKRYRTNDIHVVVGYYQGNSLPWIHQENISLEILNMNMYSPDPKAGENGSPVILPSFETPKMQKLFQINRYNLMASDRIPLNRSLPDVRRRECRDLNYNRKSYPTTSVIIVFHNEAWSVLLRTVYSVISRSPLELLAEVILVDDASQREFLRKPLEDAVLTLPIPVRILRSPTRIGLIAARLMGAKTAVGDVLTFLDAHCECTQGWLEPLLDRIHTKRNVIVSPVIDIIHDETFQYVRSFELHQGGINWELHFRWFSLSAYLIEQRQADPTKSFRTPVMAGGLFAINKEFFYDLGSYDEKMDIWGGENIEISFRGWMCGAELEIVPCSHVAHLFRKSSPYTFPGGVGNILHANLARVALVWMDEWKEFYFTLHPEVGAHANNQSQTVDSRQALRKRLNCHPFSWYLENIWSEHFFPAHDRFVGKIRNAKTRKCLQRPKGKSFSQPIGDAVTDTCILEIYSLQIFIITLDGYVKTDENLCLDAPEHKSTESRVRIMACNTVERQRWTYVKGTKWLQHIPSQKCLDLALPHNSISLMLKSCHLGDRESKQWLLEEIPWSQNSTGRS